MKKKLAMDYEKKYKEALERAKKLRDNANGLVLQKWCENVFPELKESEERIRKEIIAFLKENLETGRAEETWSISGLERWIAWIEKQGKKQQKTPIWKHWKNGIAGNGEGKPIYLIKHGYTYRLTACLSFECDYIELSELDKLLSEEQGEQKHKIQPKFKIGDIIRFKGNETLKGETETHKIISYDNELYVFADGTTDLFCEQDLYELVEQKPVDKVEPKDYSSIDPHFFKPVDKVKPKFHKRDWCIDNQDGTIFQIMKVLDNTYTYKTIEGKEYSCTHYSLENDARLWTIQDAKDGDVLATENFIFIFKNIDNGNGVHYYCHYEISKHEDDNQFGIALPQSLMGIVGNNISHYSPATKEQRDQLKKAMADAGYTFDFDKKELKKIEQKPAENKGMNLSEEDMTPFQKKVFCIIDTAIEEEQGLKQVCDELLRLAHDEIKQKPAWSEEDEKHLSWLIEHLGQSAGLYDNLIDWLKSLKDRYTWKPSDEQIHAFEQVYDWYNNNFPPRNLDITYNDLKKLKGE